MASQSQLMRSSVARRVTFALQDLTHRGEFRDLQVSPKLRVGLMTHRLRWLDDRLYRFVIDVDAAAVMFPAMLPATLPPKLLRELSTFLRQEGEIDGERGELRVFIQHGALTLSVTIRNDAYEYCTEYLVRLADRVLGSFLKQPAYDNYRIQTLNRSSAAAEYA